MTRHLVVVLVAAVLTASLYVLMDHMVARDRIRLLTTYDARPIEFLRSVLDDETRTKDRRRKPPPKPQELKKVRSELDTLVSDSEVLPQDMAAFDIKSLLGEGGGVALGRRLVDGSGAMEIIMANELTPLSMLPPQYPHAALMNGLEGWVDLIFMVDERGIVGEVAVVDARPTGTFDNAAVAGATRWRFRPVMIDGRPRAVRARTRVIFELPD